MKNLMMILAVLLSANFAFAQETTIKYKTDIEIEAKGDVAAEETIQLLLQTLEKEQVIIKAISGFKLKFPKEMDLKDEEQAADEALQLFMTKVQPFLAEHVIPSYLEVMQEKFTKEELKELLEFYETDLGAKLLEVDFIMYTKVYVKSAAAISKYQEEVVLEIGEKYASKKWKKKNKKKLKALKEK